MNNLPVLLKHIGVLFLMCVVACNCQRTYLRSCDCEYIDNGRCAYTLMIPLPGNTATDSCPTQAPGSTPMPTAPDDAITGRLDEIQSKVDMLHENVTSLDNDRASQMGMIAQLQSKSMQLEGDLTQLQTDVKTLFNESNTSDGTPSPAPCCQAINESMLQLTDDVNGALMHMTNLNKSLSDIMTNLENTRQELSDLNNDLALQKLDIGNLTGTLSSLATDYFLCRRKGLLVSGDESYLPDSAINASSTNNSAVQVRIHTVGSRSTDGAWCADVDEVPDFGGSGSGEDAASQEPLSREWVQFDLGSRRPVFGVVTRGRSDYEQWVTSYKLEYSDNAEADDSWTVYANVIGEELEFEGNQDSNTTQTNMLWQPITARFVRIVPLAGRIQNEQMGNRCMRADLIGCVDP